jgi:hypothetical protein
MIYYFADPDSDEEPDVDMWDIWNYFIPLTKKWPKVGDRGLFISFNSEIAEVKALSPGDEPEEIILPSDANRAIIEIVFKRMKVK